MGMFDSFHDENSRCPKCQAGIDEWQTKMLQSLGEHWNKGDWLQYHRWEAITKPERDKIKKKGTLTPLFYASKKYLSDAPLLFNGKIPVHMSCNQCHAWLEAYAKIVGGHFVGIVEAEADVGEKEMISYPLTTSAKSLREEFDLRLSQLRESCKHEKKEWMDIEWAPSHFAGQGLVCRKCEKILETRK